MSVKLEGKTLEVYKFLVRRGRPLGVREIQRAIRLKSPSLALYHLRKLEEMGLVERLEGGKYCVKNYVKIDALKHFLLIGRLAIPRLLFYSVFLTSLSIFYCTLMDWNNVSMTEVLGLIIVAFSTFFLWLETLRMLKE